MHTCMLERMVGTQSFYFHEVNNALIEGKNKLSMQINFSHLLIGLHFIVFVNTSTIVFCISGKFI